MTDYVAATTGVGEKAFTPTLDQVIFALKTNVGLENAQVVCMGLIKISLLLYYKRIFVLPTFEIVANILIGVVIVFELTIVTVCKASDDFPFPLLETNDRSRLYCYPRAPQYRSSGIPLYPLPWTSPRF